MYSIQEKFTRAFKYLQIEKYEDSWLLLDQVDTEISFLEGNLFNSFDFSKILKLQELYGVFSKNDKNTDLLLALKPHLNEEKQEKIDKAIKILKLLAVWNILKDSGLLKDFL